MKKNVYLTILTIITVICIIAGSCYHIIGWGISLAENFNLPFFDDNTNSSAGKLTDSGNISLDEFTSIQADINVMDLNIINGQSYSISYSSNEKLIPEYKVENNVLKISQPVKKSNLFGSKKCKVTITVPNQLDTIDITADVGEINLEGLSAALLTLKADVGDIDVSDCNLENVELDTDVGDVDVSDCTLENVELGADVGDIDFNNSTFLTMNASNGTGDITVSSSDLSDYQIQLETSIGEVCVNDQNYRRKFNQDGKSTLKLTINNSTGDIDVTYR